MGKPKYTQELREPAVGLVGQQECTVQVAASNLGMPLNTQSVWGSKTRKGRGLSRLRRRITLSLLIASTVLLGAGWVAYGLSFWMYLVGTHWSAVNPELRPSSGQATKVIVSDNWGVMASIGIVSIWWKDEQQRYRHVDEPRMDWTFMSFFRESERGINGWSYTIAGMETMQNYQMWSSIKIDLGSSIPTWRPVAVTRYLGRRTLTIRVWPPLAVMTLGLGLYWAARIRTSRRMRTGQCPSCGYNLAGLGAGAKCPECGAADRVTNPELPPSTDKTL